MKNLKRLIVLIVSVIFLVTSQSGLILSAQDPKLTSRKDFLWGVAMHSPPFGPTYVEPNLEMQLHQAAELGCKLIRVDAKGSITHTDKLIQLANEYGMKIMLIIDLPNKTFDDNYNLQLVEQTFRTYAKRYNGKQGHGKVDFIQIDNEVDNDIIGYSESVGMNPGGAVNISDLDATGLKNISLQFAAAIKGVKSSGSDAKTIINIGWTHYGMLKYLQQNGVDWDVTGHDWYEGMFHYGGDPEEYYGTGQELYDLFKKPIIICETNMWQNTYNGKDVGPDEDDYNYWDPIVDCMSDYYNKDFVIGVTFYELWDELAQQNGGKWLGEAHFGLIKANHNGTFIDYKPIYHRIQNIIGGGKVKQIDWNTVKKKYSDDDDDEDFKVIQNSAQNTTTTSTITIGGNTQKPTSSESSNVNSTIDGTVSVHYEEHEDINLDNNNTISTPIIIAIVAAGVFVLATIGVGAFFILKKPKTKNTEETQVDTKE